MCKGTVVATQNETYDKTYCEISVKLQSATLDKKVLFGFKGFEEILIKSSSLKKFVCKSSFCSNLSFKLHSKYRPFGLNGMIWPQNSHNMLQISLLIELIWCKKIKKFISCKQHCFCHEERQIHQK